MPFPDDVRQEALVRSGRHCCVCTTFAGRDAVAHHIVPEADGGPNTLDNAIVLCPHCHAEAGHYNPRHPLGTKYRPDELRRHRDDWWRYRDENYSATARPSAHVEPPGSGRGLPVQRKTIGILWSRRADIAEKQEIIEFEGRLVATANHEDMAGITFAELFQRGEQDFFVFERSTHRGDWTDAIVHGAPYFDEHDTPLRLADVQERFPQLAAAAGLHRVRRV